MGKTNINLMRVSYSGCHLSALKAGELYHSKCAPRGSKTTAFVEVLGALYFSIVCKLLRFNTDSNYLSIPQEGVFTKNEQKADNVISKLAGLLMIINFIA